MAANKICLGFVERTGKPCTSKQKDINGFCHNHVKQSIEYAKTHHWSLIVIKDGNRETYVKVEGIVPGAFRTSAQFGKYS